MVEEEGGGAAWDVELELPYRLRRVVVILGFVTYLLKIIASL